MKSGWRILLVLPIFLFAKHEDRGFFFTIPVEEEFLDNLAFEEESSLCYPFGEISPEDFDSQGLSLIEIDERDASLALWSEQRLASEEKSTSLEKMRGGADFDEAFSFDLPATEGRDYYVPALETIPESNRLMVQN